MKRFYIPGAAGTLIPAAMPIRACIEALTKSDFRLKFSRYPLLDYRPRRMRGKCRKIDMIDALGFLASGLVLATFLMRSMGTLRIVALMSNLCFIFYAALMNLMPILILHMTLLVVNIWRLAELADFDRNLIKQHITDHRERQSLNRQTEHCSQDPAE